MGIVNCTPDSFYPDSRAESRAAAVQLAQRMIDDGADILDIGGESTRPGSDPVNTDEEIVRVVPVIEEIRGFSDIPISIDTRKAAVAGRALERGADMINDVSAGREDCEMLSLAAASNRPIVLMHMRGTPKTMQQKPYYEDTITDVVAELQGFVRAAVSEGVKRDRIILDPGIGFAKRLSDNLKLLKHIDTIRHTGFPVLVGLSRKSFMDKLLGLPVTQRLAASLAAEAFVALKGAEILRVHDVRETVELAKMLDAIQTA